jgi:carbonic anhydrase
MATTNETDIQQWMEEVAKRQQPRKKLIFNKQTKKIEAVTDTDPRADRNLNFDPEEAKRFSQNAKVGSRISCANRR